MGYGFLLFFHFIPLFAWYERQNLHYLLALLFIELYVITIQEEKSQTLSKLCFYSVPLNGSIMDVLDWQKHQKGNGTVHSVQLQWRGEAADINKYLHLENKLLTKGFMGDLCGGRNPHHTSSQPLKEGLT